MEIQVLEQNSNVIVEAFNSEGGAQSLFDKIAEQARSVVPDLSTDKGRKAIASLARKVASTKTAFDSHGKELKEQYTVITNKIDADRKLFRDQCDALRDEIRKPLTDWENTEKGRVASHQGRIFGIKRTIELCQDAESLFIKNHIEALELLPIDDFEEFEQEAKITKFETLVILRTALVNREKYEAEQAELEALRLAEQQRIQREHEERIAREATEKAQREAAEAARIESERVEREKQEAIAKSNREKLESEQREARLVAEKEAAVLREQALKQKAIDDAKQAEIDKQQAIEVERNRIEADRIAKAEAERKEQEQREANKAHKKQVCDSIIAELAKLNIDEKTGQALIKAIYANQIPNITIKF